VAAAFADTETLLAVLGTGARREIMKSHCCHSKSLFKLQRLLQVLVCGPSCRAIS
jgi:hypothetical protein